MLNAQIQRPVAAEVIPTEVTCCSRLTATEELIQRI